MADSQRVQAGSPLISPSLHPRTSGRVCSRSLRAILGSFFPQGKVESGERGHDWWGQVFSGPRPLTQGIEINTQISESNKRTLFKAKQ